MWHTLGIVVRAKGCYNYAGTCRHCLMHRACRSIGTCAGVLYPIARPTTSRVSLGAFTYIEVLYMS
jgi:hypothetical protein